MFHLQYIQPTCTIYTRSKINVFPFTVCCLHFHSNKLKPLNFCYCIWHFTLCMKDIKYFRCQEGEHLFSLITSNADYSICVSRSWCNTKTVFRTWPWISEHKSTHMLTTCSQPGNSNTRQLLSARAARTACTCLVKLSSKCTSVQQIPCLKMFGFLDMPLYV